MGLRIRVVLVFFAVLVGFMFVFLASLYASREQSAMVQETRLVYDSLQNRQAIVNSLEKTFIAEQLQLKKMLLRNGLPLDFKEEKLAWQTSNATAHEMFKALLESQALLDKRFKLVKPDIEDLYSKYKDWEKQVKTVLTELAPPKVAPTVTEHQPKSSKKGHQAQPKPVVVKEVKRDFNFFHELDKRLVQDDQEILRKIGSIRAAFDEAFKQIQSKNLDESKRTDLTLIFLISVVPLVVLLFIAVVLANLSKSIRKQLGAEPKVMKKILLDCKQDPHKPLDMPMMEYGNGSVFDLLNQVLLERPYPVDRSLLESEEAALSTELDKTLSERQQNGEGIDHQALSEIPDSYYQVVDGVAVPYAMEEFGAASQAVDLTKPLSNQVLDTDIDHELTQAADGVSHDKNFHQLESLLEENQSLLADSTSLHSIGDSRVLDDTLVVSNQDLDQSDTKVDDKENEKRETIDLSKQSKD